MQSRIGALADGISGRPLANLSTTWVSSKLPDRFLIFDTVARRRPRKQKSHFPKYLQNLIREEAKIFRVDRKPFGISACRRTLVSDFNFRSDGRPNFLMGPKRADLLLEFYSKFGNETNAIVRRMKEIVYYAIMRSSKSKGSAARGLQSWVIFCRFRANVRYRAISRAIKISQKFLHQLVARKKYYKHKRGFPF